MDCVTNLHVALLCGGWSAEREVSLASGRECAAALKAAGFVHIDIVDIAQPEFIHTITDGSYDVAFIALHGRYGEDGCIQGFLELLKIPYTFSDVRASALASDKALAKDIYRQHGIPTPESVVLCANEPVDTYALIDQLGLPVFVKPVSNGSSFGVTRVDSAEQMADALACAYIYDNRVLVERFCEGTEITVPVLGNEHPEALPAVEIRVSSGFYDQISKYEDPAQHHIIPPQLPEDWIVHAQELACRAHVALGCSGATRSDFILSPEGIPYMLETNVVPGMTSASLVPDAAQRMGMGFPELCRTLIELALERAEHRQKLTLQPQNHTSRYEQIFSNPNNR